MPAEDDRKPAEGVCITLYNDAYPDRVLDDRALLFLRMCLPEQVMVHAGPRALLGKDPQHPRNRGLAPTAERLRAELPRCALWVGIGVDGWVRGAAAGDVDNARKMLCDAADAAVAEGAKLVVWDLEAAGEDYRIAAAELGRYVTKAVADKHPGLVQTFTSFPLYCSHKKLPFASWHPPEVKATIPQLYVGQKGGAPRGALQKRVAEHLRDRARSVELGLVPAGTPWWWYLQAHSTPPQDMVDVAMGPRAPHQLVYWALWGRSDEGGREAVREICDRRRPQDGDKGPA